MEKEYFDSIGSDKDTLVIESPSAGEENAIENNVKAPSKALYALFSVLAVTFGTAAGLAGAVTYGLAHMLDATGYSEKEIEEVSEWGWASAFPSAHAQSEFVSKGITTIIILAIIALLSVIALCIMTGRFSKDEHGKPVLNWFDNIWSEIQIILLCCSASGAIALAFPIGNLLRCDNHIGFLDLSKLFTPFLTDEYIYGMPNDTIFWYCAIGMAACIWITAVVFVSLVKKIKAGRLIKGSLIWKILLALGWGAKQTSKGAAKAGAHLKHTAENVRKFIVPADSDRNAILKMVIKYCLLAITLLLVPLVLYFMSGNFAVLLVFELLSIVCACVIIYRKIKKLEEIRAGVIEVKSGNLSYKINVTEDSNGPKTDLDKLAADINHISDATNVAVQNEIKNQRLKTDLISNVSHDLKTPLTSMISYLDILEKEGLDSEDAPAHLSIVREKTERLRVLTEELFEAAKASSGNIPCEIENIDLAALIDQSLAEMGDRLAAKDLDIKKNIRVRNTHVLADGKLLYRVLENLLSNISKYALEGSRVYIDVSEVGPKPHDEDIPYGKLLLEIKNISRDELNISPEELMERFTRGDQSRNTEGSGLGLAIAKDLTTLMGGSFDIKIDGDMFKTCILLNEAN